MREFIELAFVETGVSIRWDGNGIQERGICQKTNRTLVHVDARYFRPTEVDILLGNPAKARTVLGWHHRIGFRELVKEMVANDLTLARTAKN